MTKSTSPETQKMWALKPPNGTIFPVCFFDKSTAVDFVNSEGVTKGYDLVRVLVTPIVRKKK